MKSKLFYFSTCVFILLFSISKNYAQEISTGTPFYINHLGNLLTLPSMDIAFELNELSVNKDYTVISGESTITIISFSSGKFQPKKGNGIPCDIEYSPNINIKESYPNIIGMVWLFEIPLEFTIGGKKYFAAAGSKVYFNKEGIKLEGIRYEIVKQVNENTNATVSKLFLEENKKNSSIKITNSGLQYQILIEGNGSIPVASDKVEVHYHGTLIDGTVFDSSIDRGQPVSFLVTNVIKGLQEALLLMPVGSKWKLFIPSELAYGSNPRPGGPIKPDMVLIFEVELLKIVTENSPK